MPYGIAQSVWNRAKEQARGLMIARARLRGMITYSDLARGITAVRFDPFNVIFFHMLGEISAEEDAAGRGMLSAMLSER